ncbi:AraC family transcriptional regulator [Massilia endophytica]|uniref:AraC family transcriptional regulator n=1 Tax=Massilia endophytica TaxID=2899220 RepID=UPI001E4DDDB1|nr:AraC family transcriptional regulator [Massilia endophytica]UGQ48695.1 AraC family transcriptional regulator [Massilia endophytica]
MPSHAFSRQFEEPFDTGPRSFGQPYLLYAAAGAFHLEAEHRSWLLPPHRAALIPADTPIRVSSAGPAASASVLFERGTEIGATSCVVFTVTPLLREMVAYSGRWDQDSAAADPRAEPFFQVLASLAREAASIPDTLWFPCAASEELRRAMAYTVAHFSEPLSLAQVAEAASVSARTLNRRFADEAGMSWTSFLLRVRVVRATEALLTTRQTAAEIAYAHGFGSASRFAQAFRSVTGASPGEFRRPSRAAARGGLG